MDEIYDELASIHAEEQQNNDAMEKIQARNKELAARRRVLSEQLKMPVFDKENRTVRWKGNSVQLSPQKFQILYVLYFAASQQLSITDLETAVWSESKYGTKHSTIKAAVSKLGTFLNDKGFPLHIEGVKVASGTYEVDDRKGLRVAKTRPALTGYRLI